jgi:UDP-3-O-[3-hydroxymyristoyl] N-acetylglucosamine deacetylase
MKAARQTTLRRRAHLFGAGVHSNAPAKLTLHPADADHGIVFYRSNVPGGDGRVIEAVWSQVTMTELCTVIGDASEGSVATIEHLMAALSGLGIDNVLVEVDGPEVPIMDGSAARFVDAIDEAGIVELSAPRRYVKILKPVRIDMGRGFSELRPASSGFRLDVEIDFSAGIIGRQSASIDLEPHTFRREISRARTFGFIRDVERLSKTASRSKTTGSSIRRDFATTTNSCATRRSTPSAISHWQACR